MTKILDAYKLMVKESKSLGLRERMLLYKKIEEECEKISEENDRERSKCIMDIFKKIQKNAARKLECEAKGVQCIVEEYDYGEQSLQFHFQHQGVGYRLLLEYISDADLVVCFSLTLGFDEDEHNPKLPQLMLPYLKQAKKLVAPWVKHLELAQISRIQPFPELNGDIPIADDLYEILVQVIDSVLGQVECGE